MYSFWYNAPTLLPTGDKVEMELHLNLVTGQLDRAEGDLCLAEKCDKPIAKHVVSCRFVGNNHETSKQ